MSSTPTATSPCAWPSWAWCTGTRCRACCTASSGCGCFTQDDAHIFCLPEQVEEEVLGVIELILRMYETFGFDKVHLELSTRPEKSIGSDEMWAIAEAALAGALDRAGLPMHSTPATAPSTVRRSTSTSRTSWGGRGSAPRASWTSPCPSGSTWSTSARTTSAPARHAASRGVSGASSASSGILDRALRRSFPAWLAPVQAAVVPVADRHAEYATEVKAALEQAGLRVDVDLRSESVSKKIRDGEVTKVPFMLVVGDREVEQHSVTVRARGSKDTRAVELGQAVMEITEHCRPPEVATHG